MDDKIIDMVVKELLNEPEPTITPIKPNKTPLLKDEYDSVIYGPDKSEPDIGYDPLDPNQDWDNEIL